LDSDPCFQLTAISAILTLSSMPPDAQNFKNAFEDATEKMSKLLGVGPSDEEKAAADETADALGGLKVKEENAGSPEEAPKEKEEKSKETEEEH
jgi:hypothetical protein